MTQKTNQNSLTLDVRVRERNLRSGALTDKDLEKHLAGLPDLADQAEPFALAQPALSESAAAAPAAVESADDIDDEADDEDVAAVDEPATSPAAESVGPTTPEGGEQP